MLSVGKILTVKHERTNEKKITKSSQTSYMEESSWKTKNIFCSQSPLAIRSLDVVTTATWPPWRLFSTQIVDYSDMSFLK